MSASPLDRPAGRARTPNGVLAQELASLHATLDQLTALDPSDLVAPGLDDPLVSVLTARRRLDAFTATLANRFAHGGEYLPEARTAKTWMAAKVTDRAADMGRHLDRGEVLGDHYPVLADAWAEGRFSGGHADVVITAHDRFPSLREALAAVSEHLLVLAAEWDPNAFATRVLALCHRFDPDAVAEEESRRRTKAHLNVSTTYEDMVRVDGLLPPEVGAAFVAALDAARRKVRATADDADGPGQARRASEVNVDALNAILVSAATATGPDGLPAVLGDRPIVHATVPLEALTYPAGSTPATGPVIPDGGIPVVVDELGRVLPPPGVPAGWLERHGLPTAMISALAAQTLACDATIEPLIVAPGGQVAAVLPRRRTVSNSWRRAVIQRDQYCRFPDCQGAIAEIHHMLHWAQGGLTVMANLLALCWYHHQVVHRELWTLTGDPAGQVAFANQLGRSYLSTPPLPW